MKIRIIVGTAAFLFLAGLVCILTPVKDQRTAVFGRTLRPCPPFCQTWDGKVAIVNRTQSW